MKHEKISQKTSAQLASDLSNLEHTKLDNAAMREAIECNPMPYCVYDSHHRLVASNAAYGRIHPALAKMKQQIKDGEPIYYSDIVREQLTGTVPEDALDEHIKQRVWEQENADGSIVEREYGNQHFRIVKFRLPSGGTAGLAFNITEIKEREAELAQQNQLIENASRDAETALAAERVAKLNSNRMSELGEWLQSCQSLDELFRVVKRFMEKMFPHSSGELYIYSNSRDVLDGACHWNSKMAPHAHIEPGDCWALRRGRILNYGMGFAELVCEHVTTETFADPDEPRYACIPIIAHGDTVGLLHMRLDRPGFDTVQLDTSLATHCAEQISLAIANVKLRDELHEKSNRDPLTGLFNRRYFLDSCRTQFVAAEREKSEFSIISIDADHFKNLNDVHGHEAGDTALVALSNTIKAIADSDGIAARFGGEEFSILLPNASMKAAKARAEVLRQTIATTEILYAGVALPQVTVSCGVACSSNHGPTPRDILKAADVALYEAKEQGRNTVITA